MTTDEFIILVYNNLKGEISDTDFTVLNTQTMSNPDLAKLRLEIEDTWDLSNSEQNISSQTDKDRGFAKLMQRNSMAAGQDSTVSKSDNLRVVRATPDIEESPVQLSGSRSKFKVLRNVISGVAACFLLVFGAMWFLQNQGTTYVGGIAGKQITLSDNSIVDLAANSELQVSKFGETREMTLNGSANFKVTSNPTQPFIVYTEKTRTEVLGTEFLIKEVNSIQKTVLQVTEGKVKFSSSDLASNITVIANESVILDNSGILKKINPLSNLKTTKTSSLSYDAKDLPAVLEEIMIIFDTSISYDKNVLQACNVSGIISSNDIASVLSSLAKQFQFSVDKEQNNWIISGGNCD